MNGTNYINLTWNGVGNQGGFFGNSTNATSWSPGLSTTAGYAFTVDSFTMIGEKIWPSAVNSTMYFRYWLDPWPDNAATGIYNTTYKIRAVETGTAPGSGLC
jgi:hypothetical protein